MGFCPKDQFTVMFEENLIRRLGYAIDSRDIDEAKQEGFNRAGSALDAIKEECLAANEYPKRIRGLAESLSKIRLRAVELFEKKRTAQEGIRRSLEQCKNPAQHETLVRELDAELETLEGRRLALMQSVNEAKKSGAAVLGNAYEAHRKEYRAKARGERDAVMGKALGAIQPFIFEAACCEYAAGRADQKAADERGIRREAEEDMERIVTQMLAEAAEPIAAGV